VAKIVSLRDKKPAPGIVGFQRFYSEKLGIAESNLTAVPAAVLEKELEINMGVCM